jgi:hypothetical protein
MEEVEERAHEWWEMIVARVRVYGWVASHLKRRIVMTGGIDYVNTPVPKVE